VVTVFLRRAGFSVIYLGQDTPTGSLARIAGDLNPDVIILSSSSQETAARLLDTLPLLERLRRPDGQPATLLAYGGRIFEEMPALRHPKHLYLGANATQALQILQEALGWP